MVECEVRQERGEDLTKSEMREVPDENGKSREKKMKNSKRIVPNSAEWLRNAVEQVFVYKSGVISEQTCENISSLFELFGSTSYVLLQKRIFKYLKKQQKLIPDYWIILNICYRK